MAVAKKIQSQNKVIVVGTAKSKFLKTGKSYEVSEIASKNLLKNGHATLKKK